MGGRGHSCVVVGMMVEASWLMVDTSMVTVVRPRHVGATVYTVMTPSRQVATRGHVALAPRGHV